MGVMASTAEITRNAEFLAHRYDATTQSFQFVALNREQHRRSTFLTDEYIPGDSERIMVPAQDVVDDQAPVAPIHFIFHSAFACSTMLARALDIEGISMGLKEPIVLNDLVGMKRAGVAAGNLETALGQAVRLLARPFSKGETVVVKPSNIVNGLVPLILDLRPDSKALLLHAPLKTYLQSLAAKNMWGRIWARETAIGIMQENGLVGGFASADLLRLTDIQVAAVAWLSEQARFAKIVNDYGSDRIRTLNSETFLANEQDTIASLAKLFQLDLSNGRIIEILDGPAFTEHSKDFSTFDSNQRSDQHASTGNVHGEEIDMVVQWTAAVAQSQNIALELGSPLLSTEKQGRLPR
jgi:hypothetical protein